MSIRFPGQLRQGVSSAGVPYEDGALLGAEACEKSISLGPGLRIRGALSVDIGALK